MRRVNDNSVMAVSRRSLARMLAGAAAAAQTGVSQTAPVTDEDLKSAQDQMRANAEQIAKVKLPMATEPAFHFKA
jgi:pyocin large subunit-like protein